MSKPLRKTHPLVKIINNSLIDLPTPNNLSIWWNFGSLLGLCLVSQIITGLFLAMFYVPHIDLAFSSVAHLARDVNYGWALRSFHANGASMFFICLYLHIGRSLYYGSYKNKETWNIGVILLILVMATAFMGYVLPWGQMSFWGATVITNLLSAIPYVGKTLVEWVWGGFAVDNATLTRFFAIHFLSPFMIVALSAAHLLFLHQTGSNNPLGITSCPNKIPFHIFYTTKDLTGFIALLMLLSSLALFFPNLLSDPENFIPANPLITPVHIMPEWYFLWAYAILRSIPNKLGGVTAMFTAILFLFLIPPINIHNKHGYQFSPPTQISFWLMTATFLLLTWTGGRPVEEPFSYLSQHFTLMYFVTHMTTPLSAKIWQHNL